MQNNPIIAIDAVIVKQTHHQRGARSSTTPEMRSVIQLKLRRFSTNGTRASGRATLEDASPLITSGAVGVSSIRALYLFMFLPRTSHADIGGVRHFRIRIAESGQITRPGFHV